MSSSRCLSFLVCSCVLGGLFTVSVRADEGSDWTALIALRQQIGDDAFKNKPQEAVTQLQGFYTSRKLHPILAAEVVLQVAEITRMQLKQPDEAMKMLQAGLQEAQAHPNKTQPVEVMYLEGEAATLLNQNKAADAQKLLQDHFSMIEVAATCGHPHMEVYASRALQRLDDAQKAVRTPDARPDDTISLLQKALTEMPVFLNPERQKATDWHDGWMYERLVAALAQEGRDKDALSWGKLFFAEAAFDQDSIVRATKTLSGVWAKSDDLAPVRAFASAQTGGEGAAANPLSNVPFPSFAPQGAAVAALKDLKAQQAQGPWRGRAASIISLEIALQQWRPAMQEAQGLIVEDAGAPDGPQQVARVFKAKDGSVARANAFLSYLLNKAPNPVPTFLQEADAQTQAQGGLQ